MNKQMTDFCSLCLTVTGHNFVRMFQYFWNGVYNIWGHCISGIVLWGRLWLSCILPSRWGSAQGAVKHRPIERLGILKQVSAHRKEIHYLQALCGQPNGAGLSAEAVDGRWSLDSRGDGKPVPRTSSVGSLSHLALICPLRVARWKAPRETRPPMCKGVMKFCEAHCSDSGKGRMGHKWGIIFQTFGHFEAEVRRPRTRTSLHSSQ